MKILNVSELTGYIKSLFEQDNLLSAIMVKGEISNFKRHYSGHCYFTLKDSKSMIKVVMFKSRVQALKFAPVDGLNIIVEGYVTVFERDGQYQLYAERLIPEGIGELSLAFEQLKKKLGDEGLFDESRKKKLPLIPKTIGIVTSPTGAAIRDIITVAKRRHSGIQLVLYPVQVQGEVAPEQIARAIQGLNKRSGIDVIIIGRGGGALEELWAFNSEIVIRAIAESAIPVVSAVGHETDFTLADFAADKRAATPSQAAELVVPDVEEIKRYIGSLRHMLEVSAQHKLERLKASVEQYSRRKALSAPEQLLADRKQLLDQLISRLEGAGKNITRSRQQVFNLNLEKLNALNPLSVLARGYSVTETDTKRVVKSAAEVTKGQKLHIVLFQGQLAVSVMGIEGEIK